MKYLLYFTISAAILFLSYRISLSKALICSVFVSAFILVKGIKALGYETMIFVLFINAAPLVADNFRKDFNRHKESMRTRFEEVKRVYEELMRKDRFEIESNLEKEKKLQQILSLYEISKDMSICLSLEDVLNIFFSTLKKSFRFRVSRFVLLKDSKDIDMVYQVEIGHRINRAAPDNFDREIVNIALEKNEAVLLSPEIESHFLRRLNIIKNFETLILIPIFVEEKIAGVLYIENIPRMYFENFIILTGQFAIHFQKVVLYKRVEEMSITDSLTEVSTRRYFLERLMEEIRRSMRHKTSLSFLMMDLDHFKEKNDRFGHLVGDVILKEVASLLKSSLREIDIVGRFGGEEFAIVLADTGREEALQVAERIRQGIEGAVFKAYDEVASTTVSIGISVFPENGVEAESLIESADKALYKAKETGRNRVC